MIERPTHRIRGKKAFTLLELMIVVIIIGILSGIAIPGFIRTTEKAKGDEAITNLRLIFTGERMYRLDYNIYCDLLETGFGPLDTGLYPDYIEDMTTPARTRYFTFTLWRSGDYLSFTATATRTGGPPAYNGRTITIDQDEAWGGTWPPEWLP